jgi:hypothetical protein
MFEEKYYYTFKEQISLNNMNSGKLEGSATGTRLRLPLRHRQTNTKLKLKLKPKRNKSNPLNETNKQTITKHRFRAANQVRRCGVVPCREPAAARRLGSPPGLRHQRPPTQSRFPPPYPPPSPPIRFRVLVRVRFRLFGPLTRFLCPIDRSRSGCEWARPTVAVLLLARHRAALHGWRPGPRRSCRQRDRQRDAPQERRPTRPHRRPVVPLRAHHRWKVPYSSRVRCVRVCGVCVCACVRVCGVCGVCVCVVCGTTRRTQVIVQQTTAADTGRRYADDAHFAVEPKRTTAAAGFRVAAGRSCECPQRSPRPRARHLPATHRDPDHQYAPPHQAFHRTRTRTRTPPRTTAHACT